MATSFTDPLGHFLTWSYGTYLQGASTGWRKWRHRMRLPEPLLEVWRANRLKHPIQLLSREQRAVVEMECRRYGDEYGWRVWEVNARVNHVHAVVSANGFLGKTLRDRLKAAATKLLRQQWPEFRERPVWAVGGDWKCVNQENDLLAVCEYVRDGQDRKRDA